ncbi:hypothetical protein AAMO2058_000580400 [Amorphochlora amoebiformis]
MQEFGGDDLDVEDRGSQEEPNDAKNEESARKWHRIIRMANIINAVLLVFAGLWAMTTSIFSPLLYIFGFYVIIFSCCLGCFEFRCPLDMCQAFFLKNMGFMFYWQGRLLFHLFVASLVLFQGIVGLIIGVITIANCLFNTMVMLQHPEFFELLKKESEEMADRAMERAINQTLSADQIVVNTAKSYAMKEVKRSANSLMGMDEVSQMVEGKY